MTQTVKVVPNLANLLEIRVFSKLTESLFADVKKLVSDCKQLDGFETPFHWDCIENRKNPFIHEILCYVHQTLVGYIALYYFKDKEVEVTLTIHPEYRQVKILRLVWEQIKLTVHRNKIETEYYTFTVHQKDECMINVLKEAEANRISEIYKLVLSQKTFSGKMASFEPVSIVPPEKKPKKKAINSKDSNSSGKSALPLIRTAESSDKESLIELECTCFGTDARAYRDNLELIFQDPKQKTFVLEENGTVIGKAHYKTEGKEAFLFDFCIKPSEQNKGYGNILLNQSLKEIFGQAVNIKQPISKVYLETNVAHYLKWYKKLGFKEVAIFEHWKLYYPGFIKFHDQQYRSLVLNHYQEYDLLT